MEYGRQVGGRATEWWWICVVRRDVLIDVLVTSMKGITTFPRHLTGGKVLKGSPVWANSCITLYVAIHIDGFVNDDISYLCLDYYLYINTYFYIVYWSDLAIGMRGLSCSTLLYCFSQYFRYQEAQYEG